MLYLNNSFLKGLIKFDQTHSTSLIRIFDGPLTVTSENEDVTEMGPAACWIERDGTSRGSHGGMPYSGNPVRFLYKTTLTCCIRMQTCKNIKFLSSRL